jgi:hypothetical protein
MEVHGKNRVQLEKLLLDAKPILLKENYKDEGVMSFFNMRAPEVTKNALNFSPLTKDKYESLTESDVRNERLFPIDTLEEIFDYPEYSYEDSDILTNSYDWYLTEVDKQKQTVFKNSLKGLKSMLDGTEEDLRKMDVLKDDLDGLEERELARWRKHSDLNGYFEELYYEKGGHGEFNCQPLYLEREDIEEIIDLHIAHLSEDDDFTFEEADGFFWGDSYEEDWQNSLADFERVLRDVDWDKETVYYDCWW